MNFFRGGSRKKQAGKDRAVPPELDESNVDALLEEVEEEDGVANTGGGGEDILNSKRETRDVAYYKEQLKNEKAGKRKLYHSLVKLAEELKRLRNTSTTTATPEYGNQSWYQGGVWKAPQLLPGVNQPERTTSSGGTTATTTTQNSTTSPQRSRVRQAVSLSDLFFNLVIVTAFTRVGIAITNSGEVTGESVLYFAVFWTIWSKEASYSTRFDTTDLSSKVITLLNCFAVLFASLSVSSNIQTEGANRIMSMSAFCSLLHSFLMARVFSFYRMAEPNTLDHHVLIYALFNCIMNLIESATWICGMIFAPLEYRYILFIVGVLLGLRIPRAFLANDFHAASSKRGVVFILLLGFMLQSIVVVATEFFEYEAPDWEQYSFIGASCLLLFCIKLLYVEDSNVLATDHALLVNRAAGLFFNIGQFALLFSTTIMGSGLTLLTHSYLAAAAALPGPAKDLVCGGFSGALLATAFIKSMHLKRVPKATDQKSVFIAAYVIQLLATLAVSGVSFAMCFGQGGYLQVLMQNDVELMWVLSGLAVFLVALGMLDEGLVMALHDGEDYLVHPFGFWCCIFQPEIDMDVFTMANNTMSKSSSSGARLSELSPLLGESMADTIRMGGDSMTSMRRNLG